VCVRNHRQHPRPDATNAVSLAYTPTTRWQDSVVHIASYAKWVNLGFNEGASLFDPLGILVGTGAHVRVSSGPKRRPTR